LACCSCLLVGLNTFLLCEGFEVFSSESSNDMPTLYLWPLADLAGVPTARCGGVNRGGCDGGGLLLVSMEMRERKIFSWLSQFFKAFSTDSERLGVRSRGNSGVVICEGVEPECAV
jgi:hypothetical protein